MKHIIVLVDNEVAGNLPVMPHFSDAQQEGMIAAFTSNPTFVVVEDSPPPRGYIWNGAEFIQPEGWTPQ